MHVFHRVPCADMDCVSVGVELGTVNAQLAASVIRMQSKLIALLSTLRLELIGMFPKRGV